MGRLALEATAQHDAKRVYVAEPNVDKTSCMLRSRHFAVIFRDGLACYATIFNTRQYSVKVNRSTEQGLMLYCMVHVGSNALCIVLDGFIQCDSVFLRLTKRTNSLNILEHSDYPDAKGNWI